jgi:F-type H+-transporting ATPase subunit delta
MKVSTLQYAKTLLELTDNKSQEDVLDIVKKFADQLKKDGQLKNAGKIMEKFSNIYNKQCGIIVAEVVSRVEMKNDELKKIEEFIIKKYGGNTVEMKNTVNGAIKGGIVIKVGDEVIDGSIATQLRRLKKELIK